MKQIIKKMVILCLAFCLILTGISYGNVSVRAEESEEKEKSEEEKSEEKKSDEEKPDFLNILLIGQDKRDEETERQRSDAMIVITLDRINQRVCMTSFMRDLYVEIPGYGGERLNAAYQYGGFELIDQTLEDNFGIHIDGNVVIDFEGFENMIDSFGGIDVFLTQEEADYIVGKKTDVILPQHRREDWDYLKEGINTLNGEQALIHVRNRWIGQSDYERTRRQRDVMRALFDKVKDKGFGILTLIVELLTYVDTDVPMAATAVYAMEGITFGLNSIDAYRIPVDGGFTSEIIKGMQVLVPDLALNREYLQNNIGFDLASTK